jgi:hypothetical protein
MRVARTMRNVVPMATSITLLVFLLSCATSPDAQLAHGEAHLTRAAGLMARKSDADSLAAAGLVSLAKHRDQSLSLLDRARAVAPDRADLVWLQIEICQKVPPCDSEPLERQLQTLDVSNGAGWMGALVRANAAKNDEAMDAALAAIGHAERVDIYWTTLIARLSRATAETKAVSLSEATTLVIGYLAAEAIPAYHVVFDACRGERLERAEVMADCRGVAKAFERGDTFITEMVGIRIAEHVWPEDSLEWKEAHEARRVFEFRSKYFADSDPWTVAHTEEYLTMCAENRREQDVFLAELTARGKNPNPPSQ